MAVEGKGTTGIDKLVLVCLKGHGGGEKRAIGGLSTVK